MRQTLGVGGVAENGGFGPCMARKLDLDRALGGSSDGSRSLLC